MGFSEYGAHDAVGLAALVRAGQISPRELVDEAIARIERTNGRLNAVVTSLFDEARAAADGPLPDGPFRGVPFLVKDLGSHWKGARLTHGSRLFADHVTGEETEIFRRHRAAGLVVVGKTNTPELGIAPVCEPKLFGPTHTPWAPGRTSGGSSGGAGAAVGASVVPMAHGGDGGGSLRIPASCCGAFGFKPTRGRMPVGPQRSELWWGLTVEHAITRSVRDSAALLDATAGALPGDVYQLPPPARSYLDETRTRPGRLRVALSTRPFLVGDPHPDCLEAAAATGKLLTELGHEVVEAELEVDRVQLSRDFFLLVCVETAASLALAARVYGRRATPANVEVATFLCALIGRQRSAVELSLARERFSALGRQAAAFFERHDVLLTPTLATPPPPIGALLPSAPERALHALIARLRLGGLLRLPGVVDQAVRKTFGFIPYTPLANITGQPAMSVPLHWSPSGLPIGSHFIGRFGDEATLFRLAAQLEEARPWAGRRPPVSAER